MLTGCVLQQFSTLNRNVEQLQTFAALDGSIELARSETAGDPIVALLKEGDSAWHVTSYARAKQGRFFFRLVSGARYRVLGFSDTNGNRRLDTGEPRDLSEPFSAPDRAGTFKLTLRPSTTESAQQNQALQAVIADMTDVAASFLPVTVGDVTKLGDPMFDRSAAELGLWAPVDFLSRRGSGLHMLQPFDPALTPVLFVHGAAGSPADFMELEAAFRQGATGFQNWVFFYPSGLRLDKSAHMLASVVAEVRKKHRFDRLIVVAHSMGGLVAREAVLRLEEQLPALRVPLLVTLATPWGGHRAAELGVRYSPGVVPSWIDLQVGAPFQRQLLSRPLPAGTAHHLLFAFKGRGDDGVISLTSQLDPRAQAAAAGVRGFDETHMSILSSPAVALHLIQLSDR
jgi:pimeloyl-ACP methyl ester carboxylesterase